MPDSAAASAIAAATAAVAASGVQQPAVAPRPPIIDDFDDAYLYEEEEYDVRFLLIAAITPFGSVLLPLLLANSRCHSGGLKVVRAASHSCPLWIPTSTCVA